MAALYENPARREFEFRDTMSIKNIQKLKQFGIFQDHTDSNAKDFGKYNLFYGWNGSGKSTLSSLFRCIENKATSSKFPYSEFTVSVGSGTAITQANVVDADLNIYTINHDFIDENISWNSVVKSIVLPNSDNKCTTLG